MGALWRGRHREEQDTRDRTVQELLDVVAFQPYIVLGVREDEPVPRRACHGLNTQHDVADEALRQLGHHQAHDG